MKGILFFVLMSFQLVSLAQETLTRTINFQGGERSYLMYVPASYSGDEPAPLVFNFHGYGGSSIDQMRYGDFRYVADTAGFIIVHPQGSIFEGSSHWNVGSWVAGSTADDVGFTEAMIDDVSSAYNIDNRRIYSTGMSNGGYMSFLLACQLSDRIAAVASVTGSMTPNNLFNCDPQRPVPVMQIHGSNDGVVPYDGAIWTEPIVDVLDYWIGQNNCQEQPIEVALPNVNTQDGSTATFYRYDQGDEGSVVEHIRIDGGNHTWPGTVFVTPGTNLDFLASDAIWKFFLRYDIDGIVTNTEEELAQIDQLSFYQERALEVITVEGIINQRLQVSVFNAAGAVVLESEIDDKSRNISTAMLGSGTYFLHGGGQSCKFVVIR